MAVLIYPALQQPVINSDEANVQSRWYQRWPDPYLTKDRQAQVARIASGQTFDPYPLGTPEFVGPDKYWRPFSERLYPKSGLRPSLQQFLAYSESAQFPESTSIDRYLYPFSLPVWKKPAISTGDQPYWSDEPHPEDQDFMGWYQPFGEPKRFKPELIKGANPYFTTGAHALGTPYARGYVFC